MKEKIIKILDIVVGLGLLLTVLALLAFPLVSEEIVGLVASNYNILKLKSLGKFIVLIFYGLGLIYLSIIVALKTITGLLRRGEIYSRKLTAIFRRIGYSFILMGILYLIGRILFLTIFKQPLNSFLVFIGIVATFIMLALGLIFLTLAYIYREVIDIKEENDLTI